MLQLAESNAKAAVIHKEDVMKNVYNGTMTDTNDKDAASSSSFAAATATTAPATSTNDNQVVEWEEVKKARNRINSQRTRERERDQIKALEAERSRLWLSNDAIKFQNQHYRDSIARILEITNMNRGGRGGTIASNSNNTGHNANTTNTNTSSNTATAAASSGDRMGNDQISSLHFNNNNNNNNNNSSSSNNNMGTMQLMNGLEHQLGAAHKGLFGSPRLQAAAAATSSFNGLSDVDLLARHQATAQEMQIMMMRQQTAAMGGVGGNIVGGGMQMGNLSMNNIGIPGIGGAPSSGGGGSMGNDQHLNNININMNGFNNSTRALAGIAPSPFSDVADNIRLRQLMLQQSAALGGGGGEAPGNTAGLFQNNIGGGNQNSDSLDDAAGMFNGIGTVSANGIGGLGDFGNNGGNGSNGLSESDITVLQMTNKRQKLGF